MKKKLLSIMCALAMIISIMPMQMAMAATNIYLISGQPFDGGDKNYYENMGYWANYYPRNTAVSYTLDENASTVDVGYTKLNQSNIGWVTNGNCTIWTKSNGNCG